MKGLILILCLMLVTPVVIAEEITVEEIDARIEVCLRRVNAVQKQYESEINNIQGQVFVLTELKKELLAEEVEETTSDDIL